MNIYVDGEVSSGFTLDDVMLIDTKLVPQEMKDKALQRHQARQEASLTNMSFGEDAEQDDDAIAAMIKATQQGADANQATAMQQVQESAEVRELEQKERLRLAQE